MDETKEEIKIGDEVVFNRSSEARKFEVVSITHDGKRIGVRPSRKLNDKVQYKDISLATRTGNSFDHTSLLDLFSMPVRKTQENEDD